MGLMEVAQHPVALLPLVVVGPGVKHLDSSADILGLIIHNEPAIRYAYQVASP
jgi:hypothetical protein